MHHNEHQRTASHVPRVIAGKPGDERCGEHRHVGSDFHLKMKARLMVSSSFTLANKHEPLVCVRACTPSVPAY